MASSSSNPNDNNQVSPSLPRPQPVPPSPHSQALEVYRDHNRHHGHYHHRNGPLPDHGGAQDQPRQSSFQRSESPPLVNRHFLDSVTALQSLKVSMFRLLDLVEGDGDFRERHFLDNVELGILPAKIRASLEAFEADYLLWNSDVCEALRYQLDGVFLAFYSDTSLDTLAIAFSTLAIMYDKYRDLLDLMFTAYFEDKVNLVVKYAILHYERFWSGDYWNPGVRVTPLVQNRLQEIFDYNCHLVEMICMTNCGFSRKLHTSALQALMASLLPYIVCHQAIETQPTIMANLPIDLACLEAPFRCLIEHGLVNFEPNQYIPALIQLIYDFLIRSNRDACERVKAYQLDLDKFGFIFSAYGYQYSQQEIEQLYIDTLVFLFSTFFHSFKVVFRELKLDLETIVYELFHLFSVLFRDPVNPKYSGLCRLSCGLASKLVKWCRKGDQIWTHFSKVDRYLELNRIPIAREQTSLGAYIVSILTRSNTKKSAKKQLQLQQQQQPQQPPQIAYDAPNSNIRKPSLEFFGTNPNRKQSLSESPLATHSVEWSSSRGVVNTTSSNAEPDQEPDSSSEPSFVPSGTIWRTNGRPRQVNEQMDEVLAQAQVNQDTRPRIEPNDQQGPPGEQQHVQNVGGEPTQAVALNVITEEVPTSQGITTSGPSCEASTAIATVDATTQASVASGTNVGPKKINKKSNNSTKKKYKNRSFSASRPNLVMQGSGGGLSNSSHTRSNQSWNHQEQHSSITVQLETLAREAIAPSLIANEEEESQKDSGVAAGQISSDSSPTRSSEPMVPNDSDATEPTSSVSVVTAVATTSTTSLQSSNNNASSTIAIPTAELPFSSTLTLTPMTSSVFTATTDLFPLFPLELTFSPPCPFGYNNNNNHEPMTLVEHMERMSDVYRNNEELYNMQAMLTAQLIDLLGKKTVKELGHQSGVINNNANNNANNSDKDKPASSV